MEIQNYHPGDKKSYEVRGLAVRQQQRYVKRESLA